MKICAISDLHGELIDIEPVEVLFICGDIVPLKIQRNIPQSIRWLQNVFVPWCAKVPKVFLVAGNHDFVLEKSDLSGMFAKSNITYLNNTGAEYIDNDGKTWKIWGSPLCHIFGNWAFMYSNEYEENQFNKMPDEFDILLTHDPAYGRNDVLLQNVSWNTHEHIGNHSLAKVLEHKHPKYHFTGHLHTTEHELVTYNGTKTACVSLLDENYHINYKPLYLTL